MTREMQAIDAGDAGMRLIQEMLTPGKRLFGVFQKIIGRFAISLSRVDSCHVDS